MKNGIKAALSMSACVLAFASQTAVAEPMDGARILELEAEKARQIEDLEYQAKLIEQKAKLAKAYQSLKDSGGVIPGDEGFEDQVRSGASATGNTTGGAPVTQLPVLKSIGNGYAVLEYNGKAFRAAPGNSVPGGFKVLSVHGTRGVALRQGDQVYSLDIAWESTQR